MSSLDCTFVSIGLAPGVPATGPFSIESWVAHAFGEDEGEDGEDEGVDELEFGGVGVKGRNEDDDMSVPSWEREGKADDPEAEESEQAQSSGDEGISIGIGLWSFSSPITVSAAGGGECVAYSVAHSLIGGLTGREDDVYYAHSLSNGDSYFTTARLSALIAIICGMISSSIIWYMAATFGSVRSGDNTNRPRGSNPVARLCSGIPKDLLLQITTAQLLAEGIKFGVSFNVQLCTSDVWTTTMDTINVDPGGVLAGFGSTGGADLTWEEEGQWERKDAPEYYYEASEGTDGDVGDNMTHATQHYVTTRADICVLSRGAFACLAAMICCFVSMIMILGFLVKPSHRHESGFVADAYNGTAAVSPNLHVVEEGGVPERSTRARDEWADEIINGGDETSSVPSFLLSLGWSSIGSSSKGGSKSEEDRTGRRTRTSKSSSSSSGSGSGSWENYLRWKERRRKERKKKQRQESRRSSRRQTGQDAGLASQGDDSGRVRPDGRVAESVPRTARRPSENDQSEAPSAVQGGSGGEPHRPFNRRASNETERARNVGARPPQNRRGSNETERVRNMGGSSPPYNRRMSNETEQTRNLGRRSSNDTTNRRGSNELMNRRGSNEVINRRSSNERMNRRGSHERMNRRSSNETINHRGSNETMNRRASGTMNRRASNETERVGNLGAARRHSTGGGGQGRRASGSIRVVDSEWTCKACTCLNPPSCLACVACGTTRGERPSRSRYETDMSTVTFERSEKYGIE